MDKLGKHKEEGMVVDHREGNLKDMRNEKLELCSASKNAHNKRK